MVLFLKKYTLVLLGGIILIELIGVLGLLSWKSYKTSFLDKKTTLKTQKIFNQGSLFYGVNVDMANISPSSPGYVVNTQGQDLIDIAHSMHINLLRIVQSAQGHSGEARLYSKSEWDSVLTKLQRYNMKAIILVETQDPHYKATQNQIIPSSYLQLVKDEVIENKLPQDPAVYAIDIKNEPVLTSHNVLLLTQAKDLIKKTYPSTKVTVGGWKVNIVENNQEVQRWNDPQDAQLLRSIVDFYSVHLYGFDKPVNGKFPNAYTLATNYFHNAAAFMSDKPVLVGEFGVANGESITDQETLGSYELQSEAYSQVYRAIENTHDLDMLGSAAYLLYPRTNYPDGWDLISVYNFSYLPALKVLNQFASSAIPVGQSTQVSIPHDVIIKDTDNSRSITLQVGDRLGLLLTLDGKPNENFIATYSAVLNQIHPLLFDPYLNSYQAVFEATQKGVTFFTISKNEVFFQFHITVN